MCKKQRGRSTRSKVIRRISWIDIFEGSLNGRRKVFQNGNVRRAGRAFQMKDGLQRRHRTYAVPKCFLCDGGSVNDTDAADNDVNPCTRG